MSKNLAKIRLMYFIYKHILQNTWSFLDLQEKKKKKKHLGDPVHALLTQLKVPTESTEMRQTRAYHIAAYTL